MDDHRPLRSYGRTKARTLKPRQAGLVDTLLPHLALDVSEAIDVEALFSEPSPPRGAGAGGGGRSDALSFAGASTSARPPSQPSPARGEGSVTVLEIGFGGGEHLAEQARAHREAGIIGCEIFLNGIATLLAQIDAHDLKNVRIYPEDARDLLDALPERSLDRVFLLFPDPWHKRRHAERRFIQAANLDLLARLMKPGAEFRVASDDPIYIGWALAHLTAHPAFQWIARRPQDWRDRPADWPPTRYEAKALRAGRKPAYFRFLRRD